MEDLTPIRIRGKRYAPGQKPAARPKKRARRLQDESAGLTDSQSSMMGRKLSSFERLPSEVQQQIFLLCPNIHLPAASLPLCRKLPVSPTLNKELALRIFVAQGVWIPKTYPSGSNVSDWKDIPLQYRSHQSEFLRLRWMTWAFVKSVIQPKLRHSSMPTEQLLPMDIDRINTKIPSKLLHEPWTTDKLAFLKLLYVSGAQIDGVHSTDAEIASESLLDAVRCNDETVIHALLHREVEDGRYVECGVHPTTAHLITAIVDGSFDRSTIETLLWAVRDRSFITNAFFDVNDEVIWTWIHQKKANSDDMGGWLESQLLLYADRRKRYDATLVESEYLEHPYWGRSIYSPLGGSSNSEETSDGETTHPTTP